jgi:hypothetical protein
MTAEPSPRPWRVNGHSIEANDPDGLWLKNEKTGWGVVANLPSCPKSRMSKKNRETWDAIVEANAALIIEAVNERDRLRDQLAAALRLADECSRDAAAVHAGRARAVEEAQSEANRRADRLADIVRRLSSHLANYITSESENDLLREARAAIGEEKP